MLEDYWPLSKEDRFEYIKSISDELLLSEIAFREGNASHRFVALWISGALTRC